MSIINYLEKKVQEVTAPREWQSSPESPPTKLAYITQPEIDMLVKANIHGSMKGKPNKGPEGIMSLDGGGKEEAYSEKVKNFKTPSSRIDTSKQSGRDKRQEFRDRTGSSVVSEPESQQRIIAGGSDNLSDDFLEDLSGSANTLNETNLAKYGILPSQQSKFNWQDLLPGATYSKVFSNLIGAFSGANQKEFFKNLEEKLKDGKNLNIQEQSSLTYYLTRSDDWREGLSDEDQKKLDIAKDTFLPNVGTSEGGGIGDFEDQYIQDILQQVQNNPEYNFLQSIGLSGMPDDYLSQTDAMKLLGKTGVGSLQTFNPSTYYGDVAESGFGFKPRTQQELETLAKMDIGSNAGNEGLVREIARARETLRRESREFPVATASSSPVLPPPGAKPFPSPVLPGLPTPPPTAGNPITGTLPIISGDQKTNQYTQLGIPQVAPNLPGGFAPGNFGDYYNYLNQFFNTTRR
jgi:hypothetical protein